MKCLKFNEKNIDIDEHRYLCDFNLLIDVWNKKQKNNNEIAYYNYALSETERQYTYNIT